MSETELEQVLCSFVEQADACEEDLTPPYAPYIPLYTPLQPSYNLLTPPHPLTLLPSPSYTPLQVDAYEEVPAAARLPAPLLAAVYGQVKQLGGGRLACKQAEVTQALGVLASQVDAYVALPAERKLPAPVLATIFAAAEERRAKPQQLPRPQGQPQGQRRVSFMEAEGIVSEGGVRPRRASVLGSPRTEAEREDGAISVEEIVAAELGKLQRKLGAEAKVPCPHRRPARMRGSYSTYSAVLTILTDPPRQLRCPPR